LGTLCGGREVGQPRAVAGPWARHRGGVLNIQHARKIEVFRMFIMKSRAVPADKTI
jgi:hypothetical protein